MVWLRFSADGLDGFVLVEPDRVEVVFTGRDESGAVLSAEDWFLER